MAKSKTPNEMLIAFYSMFNVGRSMFDVRLFPRLTRVGIKKASLTRISVQRGFRSFPVFVLMPFLEPTVLHTGYLLGDPGGSS